MKEVRITPSVLGGKIRIPSSKSYSHRALICAALSGESAHIANIGHSLDIEATVRVLKGLGKEFHADGANGGYFSDANIKKEPLFCGESGSTLRFMIPLALSLCDHAEFLGEGRLMERPLDPYFPVFSQCGITYRENEGRLILDGRLQSGEFHLPGNVSSQFVSGLLMSLPLIPGDSKIILDTSLESSSYVDMTLDVMRVFGVSVFKEQNGYHIPGGQAYKPTEYTVESDFSQAAFFLVAGALGGSVVCAGLPQKSLQGDRIILSILEDAGAKVQITEDGIMAFGNSLNAFRADVSQCPDLAPILAVLAAFSKGESLIYNAGRLRLKESDRLSAMVEELRNIGAPVVEGSDYIKIKGSRSLSGGTVSSHNDHRIAMAMAIAANRCTCDVIIKGSECVRKSMPDFWERFLELGGKVYERDMGE